MNEDPMNKTFVLQLILLVVAYLFVGCANQQPTNAQSGNQNTQAEQAVAPEMNPPGDIPDTQAFITYTSEPGHYILEVPEGWARSEQGANVQFVDKLDGVSVTISELQSAPTAESARTQQLAQMAHAGHAVEIQSVEEVELPGGKAIRAVFTANSEKDPVTDKQVRLEENSYLFYKDGKLATLTLWAPQGADNVDQWQLMSKSFQWQ